jgi:hypothetical protein
MPPDPLLVRMQQPEVKPIEPRLDEFQVPWCDPKCPHFTCYDVVSRGSVQRCELTDSAPETLCIPGVRMLVQMANTLADLQHAGKKS